MDVILLSGSILSIILAVFLVVKKKNRLYSDKILSFWLFFFSLDFLRSYMLFYNGTMFLLGVGYILPFLYAPLLYVYVSSVINGTKKFNPAWLYHFIPLALSLLYMNYFLFEKSPLWRLDFFNNTTFNSRPVIFNIIIISASIVYPVYIFFIYRMLKIHRKRIDKIYSWHEHIDLFWINYLLISVIVLWFISLYSKFVSGYFNNLQYSDATMAVYFFELIIIMIIGYFGFKQGLIFMHNPSQDDIGNNQKYKSTGLNAESAKELLQKLLDYMDTHKPYLNSKLTISELSGMLNIPTHHLSQVINDMTGKNFFEFINSYRVEEVKRKIADNLNKQFTLLAIAFDSGFNSKSSFNNIFKKYTGITPNEYAKKTISS